jgi:ATP-dependent helicase HrpA
MRLREWQETHQQLDRLVRDMGLHPDAIPADPDAIHRALLAGLLDKVARREGRDIYRGARDQQMRLFPGSVLAARPPPWIVAAELVETRRLFARTAAPVRPRWIEQLAGDLVRREQFEPRWVRRRGQVIAYERVTFHGLLLVTRRRVNFGPIDPVSSRAIFIRAALLDGALETRGGFLSHNRDLVAEIETLEARTRRRDLLVDEESLYRFYDQRLPETVYDRGTFEAWRRRAERDRPRLLYMPRDKVLRDRIDPEVAARYPETLSLDRLELPLDYRFAPESEDDGVTVTVPLAALDQLDSARLEWLVPGLLGEKVVALLRALPKSLRRHCVPIPEAARTILAELQPGPVPLRTQLATSLRRHHGIVVEAIAWDGITLPSHLTLHLRVIDDDGHDVATGDDLAALKREFGARARSSRAAQCPDGLVPGRVMTSWDAPALPRHTTFEQGGVVVDAWPSLVPHGDGVVLELLGDPETARQVHRRGLRRLFLLQLGRTVRDLWRELPGADRLALQFVTVGDASALRDDLFAACVDRLMVDDDVRDADSFIARLASGRPELLATATAIAGTVDEILTAYRAVAVPLTGLDQDIAAANDLRHQLDGLIFPGFISTTPEEQLGHLPRYLEAARRRLEKLRLESAREQARAAELAPWLAKWTQSGDEDETDPERVAYRWLLEEFMVSLFAQELGTAQPVSAARLERQWARVRRSRAG